MEREIRVYPGLEELSRMAAEEIVRLAADGSERFSIALSGGSTPHCLYKLLATEYRDKIDWQRVHLFWGDERYVPHDDPESNFRAARETLLSNVPLPLQNINPVATHFLRPENAARAYEEVLRNYFANTAPEFDVLLLGLGTDGHTASLFPGTPALKEQERWVVPAEAPLPIVPRGRLSFTFPLMNQAKNIFFLVSGEDKRNILHAILHEPAKAKSLYPAAMLVPRGREIWFAEKAAMGEEKE
jgi:6-phosphogluconolactonase